MKVFLRDVVSPFLTVVMLAVIAILFMLATMGCTPERAYLESDQATYRVLVNDADAGDGRTIQGLRTRILNDPTLTDDERQDRLDIIDAWALRLKANGVPVELPLIERQPHKSGPAP
jgi:hypothetical protein